MTENEKVLKGILERLEKLDGIPERLLALEKPPEITHGDGEEGNEKLDADDLAKQAFRKKLEAFIPNEKLDAMTLIDMINKVNSIKLVLAKPAGGQINPPHGGNVSDEKLDAFDQALLNKNIGEVIFE